MACVDGVSRDHLVNVWVQIVLLGKRNSTWLLMPGWQKLQCLRDLGHSSLVLAWVPSFRRALWKGIAGGNGEYMAALPPLKTASLDKEMGRMTLS